MGAWDYTMDDLTPEKRSEFAKRTRVGTLKLQEAIEDLTPDKFIVLEIPEGVTDSNAKLRIKAAAKGIGKYVAVQIKDGRAEVCLSEKSNRGGGRKKNPVA